MAKNNGQQMPLNRKMFDDSFFSSNIYFDYFCVKLAPDSSCLLHAFIVHFYGFTRINHIPTVRIKYLLIAFPFFSFLLYSFVHSLKWKCLLFLVLAFIFHHFFCWRTIGTIGWHLYFDGGLIPWTKLSSWMQFGR